MDPIAFTIPIHLGNFGPIEIRWYGIMMATSMLVGAFIAAKLLRRIGRDGDKVWDGLFWIILAGVFGARLVYVLTSWSGFAADPWEMFKVWHGGLSFHGGIIAGLLATYFYFQNKGIPFIEVMDAFAPGVSLGIVLVRIGNYMNGDILGYKWDGPWAMNFPFDQYHFMNPDAIVYRHPTELYGLLVGLICVLVSMVNWIETYETKRFPVGTAYIGFIFTYSLARSIIEDPFRDVSLPWPVTDPAVAGFGLFTSSHIASFFLILLSLVCFTQLRRWEQLRAAAAAGGGKAGVSRQARRAQQREQHKKDK